MTENFRFTQISQLPSADGLMDAPIFFAKKTRVNDAWCSTSEVKLKKQNIFKRIIRTFEGFFYVRQFHLERHDIRHNDIRHNDIQHNDTQHNDIHHNDIQHNNIQHNDIQNNHTEHNGLIYETQHNRIDCHYSECHNA
jgi:hypothetical protein